MNDMEKCMCGAWVPIGDSGLCDFCEHALLEIPEDLKEVTT